MVTCTSPSNGWKRVTTMIYCLDFTTCFILEYLSVFYVLYFYPSPCGSEPPFYIHKCMLDLLFPLITCLHCRILFWCMSTVCLCLFVFFFTLPAVYPPHSCQKCQKSRRELQPSRFTAIGPCRTLVAHRQWHHTATPCHRRQFLITQPSRHRRRRPSPGDCRSAFPRSRISSTVMCPCSTPSDISASTSFHQPLAAVTSRQPDKPSLRNLPKRRLPKVYRWNNFSHRNEHKFFLPVQKNTSLSFGKHLANCILECTDNWLKPENFPGKI